MSKLGHLDHIGAFELLHHLFLSGRGTNPTSAWTNWFEPIRAMPNTYEFRQEAPTDPALQVITPFRVLGVFPYNGVKEVVVRHLVDDKPTDVKIPVRMASSIEEAAVAELVPAPTQQFLLAAHADRNLASIGSTFSKHLGTVDIPFACGTWSNPLRARRYELHLQVDALLPTPHDIEVIVIDCLKQGAVAAALALLLTPIGWAAGVAIFQKVLEACLIAKLGRKLVSVRLDIRSHCL